MYLYFTPFSLENKLFGMHQTSFLPVEALEFSELTTPLVYTFFPPKQRHECNGSHKELVARHFLRDAAFLLTLRSFLLTVELFHLQLTFLASLLTIGAFLLTILAFLLTVGAFLLTVGKCV